MSGVNGPVTSVKGPSTLVRPKFEPGMLLQHEDLNRLTTYTRELSRLLFRSFFGCGVICGLKVTSDNRCGKATITVAAGVALNCSGDPIYVPKDQPIAINENCDPDPASPLWVVLCPKAKCCAPRTAMCPSDDDEAPTVCTQERDWFEIRVVKDPPNCACGCTQDNPDEIPVDLETKCRCANPEHPCYKRHYDGECGCECDDCSGGGCDCVLLARIEAPGVEAEAWTVDHSVRRFIRPVLIRDPLLAAPPAQKVAAGAGGGQAVAKVQAGGAAQPAAAQSSTPSKARRPRVNE